MTSYRRSKNLDFGKIRHSAEVYISALQSKVGEHSYTLLLFKIKFAYKLSYLIFFRYMAESNISIESETNTARRGEDFSGKIQDDFAPNNQHWPIGTRQGERNQFHNGGFNPITNFSTTFDELCKFIDRACRKFESFIFEISYICFISAAPSSMVPLSSSVDVTHTIEQLTSSHPIELEYALESEYKPRYKSDYFPQSGNVRPPRFVTDCNGKNYVTLQVRDHK